MCKRLTNKNILTLFLTIFLLIVCAGLSFARTVTDEIGRSVNVTSVPQRIVSLAPGITETLFALNLDNEIAGVTTFCNWPTGALAKPKIGGFANPSIEKIVSMKPDLIIATADGNRKDTVQQLERLGLTVYVINPSNTKGVLKSIIHIGEITNRKKDARELIEKLQNRLNNVAKQLSKKKRPRVFFQLGMEPVLSAGRGTLIDEVIETAGGINVAGLDLAKYPHYSAEGIIKASPEIIVFAPMVNDEGFVAVKNFWQKFGEMPAVKNGRIYPIDADLINRASPRIFDALEMMAKIFHPEIKYSR